ncbi:hypothetical protein CBER1_03818 [Cercospora berteroae]|uniref:Uncharacterized protein n=1 Tax=Cercospora berteroae TaxID=357750 RepID=A0A2S6CE83_9PEZI|nr:hypothetical protein CBER1_03818 [Cercospora berteroae]
MHLPSQRLDEDRWSALYWHSKDAHFVFAGSSNMSAWHLQGFTNEPSVVFVDRPCTHAISYKILPDYHQISESKGHLNPEYDKPHINAHIRLDDGAQNLYGSVGPITGSLILKYLPYEKRFLENAGFRLTGNMGQMKDVSLGFSFPKVTEKFVETVPLSGVVTATVMLRGMLRYKIRIVRGGGQGGTQVIDRTHDKELSREQVVLNIGWLSAVVGDEFKFPFAINFPHPSRIPPPSFMDYFIRGAERIFVGVEYRMGLQSLVDGATPQVNDIWWNGYPSINYELAQPPEKAFASTLTTSTHQCKIQSWLLLPPEQRRLVWMTKTKAKFRPKTMPILTMDVFCSTCSHAHPGQVLSINVAIKKNEVNSTADSMPDILLVGIHTKLVAQLRVTDPKRRAIIRMQEFKCQNEFPIPLRSQNNHSATITLDALDQHTSSFSFD